VDKALAAVQRELVQAARRAYESGLQRGSGGNLSARLPGRDLVLIKPSGMSFGQCTEESFVGTNLEGEVVLGQGRPSRELLTHLAVYRQRSDVHAVMHCHSPWAVACAAAFGELPLPSQHAELTLGPVPVLRVEGHADQAVAQAVQELLQARPALRAFLQARHGLFALGPDPIEAEHAAELVEETAQIAWLLAVFPGGPPGNAAVQGGETQG